APKSGSEENGLGRYEARESPPGGPVLNARWLWFWMTVFTFVAKLALSTGTSSEIPVLTLSDSINPGTADYFIRGIQQAEEDHAPFVVIQLDTPGGLLQSTRQIAQEMLNSKVPVVVFVGPRGAHAGSAGALITFASDVAAMAPGTNI